MKTLAIGMTTAPRIEREPRHGRQTSHNYLQFAVDSLRAVGFPQPVHLFAEPDSDRLRDGSGVVVHANRNRLGCFPNWKQGFQWLTGNESADWYLMLQDDAVWCRSGASLLQEAIERPDFADVGCLSPYTSPAMARKGVPGWQEAKFHNRAFWGAVALCFPRESALRLQTLPRFVEHQHQRKLDVVVGNALRREAGLRILVHSPSLCEHIGSFSTLGRHKIRGIAWGRRGLRFNAGH